MRMPKTASSDVDFEFFFFFCRCSSQPNRGLKRSKFIRRCSKTERRLSLRTWSKQQSMMVRLVCLIMSLCDASFRLFCVFPHSHHKMVCVSLFLSPVLLSCHASLCSAVVEKRNTRKRHESCKERFYRALVWFPTPLQVCSHTVLLSCSSHLALNFHSRVCV